MEEQLSKALMAQFPVDDSEGEAHLSDTEAEVKPPETPQVRND
jgi:hypothetical protein